MTQVEEFSLTPKEIILQVERKHIFTHIEWDMRGIFMEVTGCSDAFEWMTAQEVNTKATLPTAFRIFWKEIRGLEAD